MCRMQCPDCHIDMQPSKLGFLCLKCGKIISNKAENPQSDTNSSVPPASEARVASAASIDQPSQVLNSSSLPPTSASSDVKVPSSVVDAVFVTGSTPEP